MTNRPFEIITALTVLLLSMRPQPAVAQVSIEFVDSPVLYSVGIYGTADAVFAHVKENVNRDSIRQIIRHELKKYPRGVLEKKARLTKIILSDTIIVSDEEGEFTQPALGTYTVPGVEGNYVFLDATSDRLPGVLHHEISSVFLGELATSDTAFARKTYNLFKFFNAQTPYYYKTDSKQTNTQYNRWSDNSNNYYVLCNDGYALIDSENDFNEIVKCLFVPTFLRKKNLLLVEPNVKLWDFLEEAKKNRYIVYKKTMMVIDYYNSIHPAFNEAYFRGLEE